MLHRYRTRTFAFELCMIALAVAFLVPVYVLVSLSLKTPAEISATPFALPARPTFDNYVRAWQESAMGPAILNSAVVTSVSVLVLVLLGSSAAYVLARRATRVSNGMYLLFLLGITLPFQLVMIPQFQLIGQLGLVGSVWSVVLVYMGVQLPFTIFLYTGFIRALPTDYGEAALVDGASHLQAFRRVVFPLLRPVTGTVIVLNVVFIWNDFLTPLIYLGGSANETIPLVVYSFVGQYVSQWGLVFAAVTLAILPMLVVYLLLQKRVIRGFGTGLKG